MYGSKPLKRLRCRVTGPHKLICTGFVDGHAKVVVRYRQRGQQCKPSSAVTLRLGFACPYLDLDPGVVCPGGPLYRPIKTDLTPGGC